jgi:IgGFc binding protein
MNTSPIESGNPERAVSSHIAVMSNSPRGTRRGKRALAWGSLGSVLLGMALACSANKANSSSPHGSGADGGAGNVINTGAGGLSIGNGGGLGVSNGGAGSGQPETCADAIANATYVGCDFWPTVVYNPVYSVFDFAAVVANAGSTPANVTVVRGTGMATATVQPGSLQEIKLPWVPELKGKDFDATTQGNRPTTSVRVDGGAYHLTSDVPVTVWQFNPVEYKKDKSVCPYPPTASNSDGVNCESVSADAALLIPSSALTGNYRVTSKSATPIGDPSGVGSSDAAGGFTITGTQDATHVKIQLTDDLAAGTGVAGGVKGSVVEFDINAGDVLELLSKPAPFAGMPHSDVSGSIVNATKPVQVIGFNPLTSVPSPPVVGSCCADHLEETVLPAEVLGKDYLVASPSTHKGTNSGHYVRFFGDFDGTTLQYRGTPPPGGPSTLSAGQVVEIAVTAGFEVVGSMPFALTSIMNSATVQNGCAVGATDPDCFIGDSSMSDVVAVEQYRTDYIFLAPDDFAFNWADVMVPTNANVMLDGVALAGTKEMVTPDWSVVRVQLMGGTTMGAHKLTSDMPVGLQVMGYGHATSYYYPGGLNLTVIAMPPVVK